MIIDILREYLVSEAMHALGIPNTRALVAVSTGELVYRGRHPRAGRPRLALLQAVVERQALLIARWIHVGFIHGVMNTDTTALSGETIDFGPCACIGNGISPVTLPVRVRGHAPERLIDLPVDPEFMALKR